MKESLDALRDYVHFLREREGVRQVRLTRTAQTGLVRLAAAVKAVPDAAPAPAQERKEILTSSPPASSLRTPGTGATTARPATVAAAPPASDESPLEISGSSKVEQLRHLAERASGCVKCPHLAARRHHVVFGVGNPDAKLMFVGEAPGEDEDLQGEPFVGRAGQLLTKMIAAMGLTREQVYIGNIVKCRPDMPPGATGNRKPTREEMSTCVPYLRAQIDVIKPSVLVALGATAVEGLIGPAGTIGSLRGKFLEYRGIALMPTYHPSYLLRNQSNTEKRKVWEDLLKVMGRLEMPISEKQRGYFLNKG
ncbi:MAG TPA: uracil-DNA glycosylase [Candidatus Methylacidiphilales bacterium]|nr:uracil-DNA glycosylase [Candidatus Methylacidiphilales bacterium]